MRIQKPEVSGESAPDEQVEFFLRQVELRPLRAEVFGENVFPDGFVEFFLRSEVILYETDGDPGFR